MRGKILILLLSALAFASPVDEYFSLLKSGKCVEYRGRVVGFIKSGSLFTLILNEGTTTCLKFNQPVPVEIGEEIRLLARPTGENNLLELLLVVKDADVRAKEEEMQKQTVFYFPVPISNKKGSLTSRAFPNRFAIPNEIVEAYKRAVLYFNPRMDDNSARLIAQAILSFSLENNLDPRLVVAVIAVESGFDPKAVSRKGAMGLGQLMPQTAAGMGVRNPFDPIENVAASIRLIRGHLEKFEGHPQQLPLALACYNAGSGAVKKYNGIPPYKETQAYINKVISLYKKICGYQD
ncbi:MAG: lytic transglycosylase domain-containing protein [bacterium]